jgi:uncharacterized protein (TIGR00159 family)
VNVTLDEFLLNVRLADALDVLVVSVVLYLVWRWGRSRASHALAFVGVGLGLLYVLSKVLSMYLTVAVFQAGLTVMLFSLVVTFQDDLRHAAERLSTWRPFGPRAAARAPEQFLDTLVEATCLLSEENIGALMVLPGRQSLQRHVRGGVPVDARISVELVHSIFHPESKGHDGGVVIQDERLLWLGVHLPLSGNLSVVGNRGTRHAAALGLSERTDALVIVVSEERGSIALAQNNSLQEIETAAALDHQLHVFFETHSTHATQSRSPRERLSHFGAQLGSFVLAAILWFMFAFRIETVQRTIDDVPVEFRNLPETWVVEGASPNSFQMTLMGPQRAFDAWDASALKVIVDLRDSPDGRMSLPIQDEHLRLPEGIRLREAAPPVLRYELSQLTTVNLPVKVITRGQLPDGRTLVRARAQPESISVRMSQRQRVIYQHLLTTPVDLTQIQETQTINAGVQIPERLQLIRGESANVQVRIEVRRQQNADAPPRS